MKKKVIASILALTLAFSLTACGSDQKEDKKESTKTEQQDETEDEEDVEEVEEEVEEEKAMVEAGTIEGNIYTNASLGIQATIPEGYVLYSDEQIQETIGAGEEMLEATEYDVDALDESGTLYELMAETEDHSANIQIAIENTEVSVGMELDADQYAQILKANLETTYEANGYPVQSAEITQENKGGLDCQVITVSLSELTQQYYVIEIDGYMVGIAVTYAGTTTPESVQQFLDSITAI